VQKNKLSSEFEKKLINNIYLSYKEGKVKILLNNISKNSGIEANKFFKKFFRNKF